MRCARRFKQKDSKKIAKRAMESNDFSLVSQAMETGRRSLASDDELHVITSHATSFNNNWPE